MMISSLQVDSTRRSKRLSSDNASCGCAQKITDLEDSHKREKLLWDVERKKLLQKINDFTNCISDGPDYHYDIIDIYDDTSITTLPPNNSLAPISLFHFSSIVNYIFYPDSITQIIL
ncbi:hypothetical protein NGRA_3403 [Nosema granulosis]|uniref:Uncharacterized protein n=1 Tax=Nosema granulosis TaxID=83296 RepID=A0A9P6KX76_9MICR|nr:hypothetical protein NGRA_3403 [Nosema granulosis]